MKVKPHPTPFNNTFTPPADSSVMSEKEKGKEAPPYEITEPSVDPPPRPTWKGAKIKDKSVWFKAECGSFKVKLNPIVTIASILVIVAFILWCILERERKYFNFGI